MTLTPSTLTIGAGANLQMKATVTGSFNRGVTWTVNGVPGGNATYGTLDAQSAYYFAPAVVPQTSVYNIVATSLADGTKSASATVTVVPTDPVGTVSVSKTVTCSRGGLSGGTCYQLTASCNDISDFNVYVKVNKPSTATLGTVMFGTGTGGNGLYETSFTYGQYAVQKVLSAGYTTAQITFGYPFAFQPNGWLQGPGGVRRLACRYAAVANWISANIVNDATKPLCATGNSGGGAVITYALSEYGLNGTISMAEVTSGPPMARVDNACLCTAGNVTNPCTLQPMRQCYVVSDANVVDPAWSTPRCKNELQGRRQTVDATLFLSDSINGPGAQFNFPKTYVNVVFGGQDGSSAVSQGVEWYNSITSQKAQSCVADAPHEIPNVLDGANQIADDLINLCRVQP